MVQRAQNKKRGEKGSTEEEKSKQVIITHPKLFHCPSHLGLIKMTKIGLIITRTTNQPASGSSSSLAVVECAGKWTATTEQMEVKHF